MERDLEKSMSDVSNYEGVSGVILTDKSGLCLGVKGNASIENSGIIVAIADQVAKLEPNSGFPMISLQGENKQCIIQREGPVIGAIYKIVSS